MDGAGNASKPDFLLSAEIIDALLSTWILNDDGWADVEEVLGNILDDLASDGVAAWRGVPSRLRVLPVRQGEQRHPAPARVRELAIRLRERAGVDIAEPERFVNSILAAAGGDRPIASDRSLAPGTRYDLLVNVGAGRPESLLPPAHDVSFPDDLLPGGELRLRAVLWLESMTEPRVVPFTLPGDGDSFRCDCAPEGGHEAGCDRDPWVRFALTTPERASRWEGDLIIYYRAAAVHAQHLVLPVGDDVGEGPRATLSHRLTVSFSGLDTLADRDASISVAPNASRITVNGLSFIDAPYSLEINAADNAYGRLRQALYQIHFRVTRRRREISRFDAANGKDFPRFVEDLRTLAHRGHELYCALFANPEQARALGPLLRNEARMRHRPASLCVLEPHTVQQRDQPIPWALVYDLWVGDDPARYRLCESVARFGPGGAGGPIPEQCPFSDHEAEPDILCPFGFWGLSYVLEQPPDATREPATVLARGNPPTSLLAATGSGLVREITDNHLLALRGRLRAALSAPPIGCERDLGAALARDDLDVAYLYCHCEYASDGLAAPASRLRFGGEVVGPMDVTKWANAVWERGHWRQHRPLVVINGCHTAQLSSSTLANFVSAFVGSAGAAGMIGTEVALDQAVASAAMEHFLTAFVDGATVGEALRDTRWWLLRLGNVMGFAYTSYCLSSLRMRAREETTA